ncbi:MAG: glycoside hydrolase family 88 protein [Clostridia bacterium]|nr:glycoside hydrolase family 88 protein [Clostridia bacterium]
MLISKNTAKEHMKKLLGAVIENDPDKGRFIDYWEWGQGVCLTGIAKAYEATDDEEYSDFLKAWFKRNNEKKIFGSVNCVIPCYAALTLYRKTKDSFYKDICDTYATWAKDIALKTTNGGLAHVWSRGGLEDYKNQLWADSLFMAGMFMVAYGKEIGDEKLLSEGIEQFKIHLECLYDDDAQLFSHGYHCIEEKRLGAHWGRGNGWVVASLSEIFNILGTENCPDNFKEVFKTVMAKAKSLKTKNGMLRTLIDREDSYEESTASQLFGYAAIRGYEAELLDESYISWANEINKALEFYDNGAAKFASGGTDCQEIAGYYNIKFVESGYSDGITFMFLSRFI